MASSGTSVFDVVSWVFDMDVTLHKQQASTRLELYKTQNVGRANISGQRGGKVNLGLLAPRYKTRIEVNCGSSGRTAGL